MDAHRIALLSAVYVAIIAASFFLSLTIFNLLDWPQHVVETESPSPQPPTPPLHTPP